MRRILHDPALDAELRRHGYARVRLLPPEEVARLRAALAELAPDDGFAPDGRGANRSTYHCTFLDTNTDYKRRAHALLREAFAPPLAGVLVDFRILTSNFYVKPPGRGRFEIHQNWPTLPSMEETSVTVWCPLVDTDEVNGTLQVVPGSHKIVPDIANIRCEPFFRPVEEALLARYLEPICLAAGEALVFDDSLIHYSAENRAREPRIAVQLETVPAEATTVLYYLDPAFPERFELFRVEPEFFTEHGVTSLLERPAGLESLGFVPNPNRLLDEAELAERLRRGPVRRRRIYGEGEPASAAPDLAGAGGAAPPSAP